MKHLARKLRRNSTEAERQLWYHLRAHRMAGFKFRRQFVIEPYIVDFVCLERKLVVEADGSQHLQNAEDKQRTRYLENLGFTVLRFWNHDILNTPQTVLSEIHRTLKNMPNTTNSFTIRPASWLQDNAALRLIREQVFIQEQNVPREMEWDGEDKAAFHLLAEDDHGNPIGTARMLADGHIGRVAVVAPWRGRKVGTALMQEMLKTAELRNYRNVFLDAQVDAIDFYCKLGFEAGGKTFMDAGIPHRHMVLKMYT